MNRDDLPPPARPAQNPPDAQQTGLMARFRNYFLTGPCRCRPDRDHVLPDLVVRELGRQPVRPFVPIAYRPETYLPFGLPVFRAHQLP